MKSKWLCCLLAVSLCITSTASLSSCKQTSTTSTVAQDDESEDVTLRWVMPSYTQSDFNIVQDKINELLPTLLPHTKLELVLDSAMGDKWQLWMAGQTSYDIAHTGFAFDLQEEIMKQSFLPLDSLIDSYAPTIKGEQEGLYKDLYNTGSYQGSLYAIPNVQYYINQSVGLKFSKSIYNYLDVAKLVSVAHSSPKTTEALYQVLDEYLEAVKSNVGTPTVDVRQLNVAGLCKRGYTFIGGNDSNLCFDPYADAIKVIDFYQTDEFKTYCKYMNKWYKDGYISSDVLTGTSVSSGSSVGIMSMSNTTRYKETSDSVIFGDAENSGNNSSDIDVMNTVDLNNPDYDIRSSHNVGSLMTYQSIPVTAENPVRAMKLLELLRTEKGAGLLNLIAYGIEGSNYTKETSTIIKAADYLGQASSTSKYGIPNWMVGNLFNMYIVEPYNQNVFDYGKNYYTNTLPTVKQSAMYGYSFSMSNVKSKMSQILSINKEYVPQLAYGVLDDYESTYETLLSRNKAAGVDDVIEDFQGQADQYIASK